MRNNIPRGVVCCAGNVPTNVVDVANQGSQPPGCVEHPVGCNGTRVAPRSTRTHTRLDDDLHSPIQRRWRKQTSGTGVSTGRQPPCSRDASIPLQAPNKGSPPWKRRGRGDDRRKPISIRRYIYFLANLSIFWLN